MRQEHSDDKKEGGNILSPNKSIQLHHHVRVLGYFLRQGYQPLKKPLKKMKKINWKAVINFIITVLTAIASSFFVSSCK